MARLFVKSPRVLSNVWHLICDNVCYILRKIAKLYFLEVSQWSLKTRQKSCPYDHPLWRNGHLKNWKFCRYWRLLFPKQKQLASSIFHESNILANAYHFWIFDIYRSTIVEITGRRTYYFGSLETAENNLITDKEKQQ